MARFLILAFILMTSCSTLKIGEKPTETPNTSETPSEIPKVSESGKVPEKSDKPVAEQPTIPKNPKQIMKGMSKAMVLQILGQPRAGTGYADNVEVLHYIKREGWRHNYYFIRLVDGKVESFGSETPAVGPYRPKEAKP